MIIDERLTGHRSILRKLLLGLLGILLLLPAFLALHTTLERRLMSDQERLAESSSPLRERAHELQVASLEMSLAVLNLAGPTGSEPSWLRGLEEARAAFRMRSEEVRGLLPEGGARHATEIDHISRDLARSVDRVVELQGAGVPEADLATERALLLASQKGLDDLLNRGLQVQVDADRVQRRALVGRHMAMSLAVDVLAVTALLGIAVGLGVAVYRDAGRTMTTLLEGTEALVTGSLSYRMDESPHDEVGLLARHFNRMAARLQASTVPRTRLKQSELQLEATRARLQAALEELRREGAAGGVDPARARDPGPRLGGRVQRG